jgi:hypothetical protein
MRYPLYPIVDQTILDVNIKILMKKELEELPVRQRSDAHGFEP